MRSAVRTESVRTVARIERVTPRYLRVQAAKQNSAQHKAVVRAIVGDERFVFDRGTLIEYEYSLPELEEMNQNGR